MRLIVGGSLHWHHFPRLHNLRLPAPECGIGEVGDVFRVREHFVVSVQKGRGWCCLCWGESIFH